jgi:diguanylate cyclase (GGDEF)-like protein
MELAKPKEDNTLLKTKRYSYLALSVMSILFAYMLYLQDTGLTPLFHDVKALIILGAIFLFNSFILFKLLSGLSRQVTAMNHQFTHDLLTGLPNRAHLLELVHQSIVTASQQEGAFAVFLLDIDRFSIVNNIFGRSKGDECLKKIAYRLLGGLPKGYIMGRIGGDEFLIIANFLQTPVDALPVLKHLVGSLIEPFSFYNHQITISCSIGVAFYPEAGESVDHLLGHADIALSQVKKTGRNGYQFYSKDMHDYNLDYLQIENQIRQALENQEFQLYYQPIFNIQEGILVGFEALIRWQNPKRGFLCPDQFIPLAEEIGLIRDIDDWVMLSACRQMKVWHDMGFTDLRIAVNISAAQFKFGLLYKKVSKILDESELPADALELELTEGMLIDDSKDVKLVLSDLKRKKVSISIDDFGTGYSCLSYLKRLDINKLKIDKSFVTHLPHNKEDETLVKIIIDLAKSFNLCVIAEGIETKDQLDLLQQLGCDLGQGFYFAKPMSVEDCGVFLSQKTHVF